MTKKAIVLTVAGVVAALTVTSKATYAQTSGFTYPNFTKLFASMPQASTAVWQSNSFSGSIQTDLTQLTEVDPNKSAEMCTNFVAKADSIVTKYTTNKASYLQKYADKKTQLLARAEKRGMDTTQLQADFATLDGKVNSLVTEADALVAKWGTVKPQIDCTNIAASKPVVDAFRTEVKTFTSHVKETMDWVRSRVAYYKGLIRNTDLSL